MSLMQLPETLVIIALGFWMWRYYDKSTALEPQLPGVPVNVTRHRHDGTQPLDDKLGYMPDVEWPEVRDMARKIS